MKRVAVGIVLGCIWLGGCVSLGEPQPEMKMYDFGPTRAQTLSVTSNAVFLGPIYMQDGLDTQLMAYRLMYRNPNRIANYTESGWRVSPRQLIRTRFLEATGLASASEANAVNGGCIVTVDVRVFEQRFISEQNAVGMLEWQASVFDAQTRQRLAVNRFTAARPMVRPDAASGVSALIEATDQAIDETAQWVQTDVLPRHALCRSTPN